MEAVQSVQQAVQKLTVSVNTHKRIIDFLAKGLSPIQVLSLTGLQPSALQALLKDEGFKELLEEEKKKYLVEADEQEIVGNKYLSLEHKILQQIESQLPSAELRDTIRALDVVSNTRNREQDRLHKAKHGGEGGTVVNNIVQLMMPSHAIPEYTLNSTKEVVAIDGKPMLPMNSANVKTLFATMKDSVTIEGEVK